MNQSSLTTSRFMLASSHTKDGVAMMRKILLLLTVGSMLLAAINPPCLAQDFKVYPGSKPDEKASREASATVPGKQSQVFTTDDPFEKVYSFYKSLYKEFTMSHSSPKLPSGQPIQWAFFILDGAKDLANSKYWMKIQRPYVGGADGQEIREVTVIQTVRSN
jgi:hypothetical protein